MTGLVDRHKHDSQENGVKCVSLIADQVETTFGMKYLHLKYNPWYTPNMSNANDNEMAIRIIVDFWHACEYKKS